VGGGAGRAVQRTFRWDRRASDDVTAAATGRLFGWAWIDLEVLSGVEAAEFGPQSQAAGGNLTYSAPLCGARFEYGGHVAQSHLIAFGLYAARIDVVYPGFLGFETLHDFVDALKDVQWLEASDGTRDAVVVG
jgi:hypothetical protein